LPSKRAVVEGLLDEGEDEGEEATRPSV